MLILKDDTIESGAKEPKERVKTKMFILRI